MSKTKVSIILDSFFITTICFIVTFIWFNRYIKNAIWSFVICIFLSFLVFFTLFKHFLKKYNLASIKSKELKFADKCFMGLTFSDKKTLVSFFEKLLAAKCISDNIYSNTNSFFYVSIRSPLTSKNFIEANEFYLSQDSGKPLCFLCKTFDTSFSELLSLSEIHYSVFTSSDVFLLMKSKNLYPTIKEEKINRRERLKNAKSKFLSSLSRKHFKKFFLSGLSLIFISMFVPFTSYYTLFGTFLLILSIVCLTKKDIPQANTFNSLNNLASSNDFKENKNG